MTDVKLAWCTAAAAVLLLLLSSADARAGEPADWQRHPLTTAPFLNKPPVIDGRVDRAEWQAAGVLGPLLLHPSGVASEARRRVWVAYDEKNLYLAFDLERPAHLREPLMPKETGRIDNWNAGEYVELMIDDGHDHADYFDFNLYANGAYSDGRGTPGVDRHWDAKWQQAASLTERGWQGEVALPFAILGVDGAPEPGSVWGLDVIVHQTSPSSELALYAHRGPNWHKLQNLGHLRLGQRAPQDPAIRFMRAEDAGQGSVAVEFAIVNAADAPTMVQAEVEMLKRKDGAAGGPKSYYDHIESGSDDSYESGKAEFAKTTTLTALVDEAEQLYEPVAGAEVRETINVPGGERRALGFVKPADPGEYLVRYRFMRSDGETLAAGVKAFRMTPQLAIQLEPHWLHARKIDATVDLRKIERNAEGELSLALLRADDEQAPLAERSVAVAADDINASLTLPTESLEPGFYQVRARLVVDGRTLAVNHEPIQKPAAPPWHNNSLGLRVKVPEPWVPLKADDRGVVEVWSRRYDLSALLPRQITSQGSPLLAAPVSLNLMHEGASTAWEVTSLELEHRDEGKAVYRGKLTSPVATLEGTVTIEFDGFVWYDLRLQPRQESLKVDRMSLDIALVPERADLLDTHTFLHDPVISSKPPVPAKQAPAGVLGDSLLPFTPHVWMGDEQGGIGWIAEAPIDWHITKPERVIEVAAAPPDGSGPAVLRVHLVQEPMEMTGARRVIFGLQASPIRPMPPVGAPHLVQSGGPVEDPTWYRAIKEHGGHGVIFHSGWKGTPRAKYWGGWPERPPTERFHERLANGVKFAHDYGLTVSLYTGWGVAIDSEAWKHFRHEMVRKPLENAGFGTYRQSAGLDGAYQDYVVWAIADLVKTYDIDGVFWDSASNLQEDSNVAIGNGWVDRQGRTRPGYAVLGTRELFKRIYTLFHGELKTGGEVVNFGGSIWCINAFADVFHRGEGQPMHAKHLREAWFPLEDYRAVYDGRKHGLATLAMNKNFKNLEMTVNAHHAVTLLHGWHAKSSGIFTDEHAAASRMGYGRLDTPIYKIWQARDWLPLDEHAKRYPYYAAEPHHIKLEPTSLLSSAFVDPSGHRLLLVVSNLDPTPVQGATVELDLAGLGLSASGDVLAEDAILQQPLELRNGRLTLDIEPERYRLLKIWVADKASP